MRWLRLNCILLASLAILSATKAEGESRKQKRDISLVKNFIKSAIFGTENKTATAPIPQENYKIFRIPGFNNILVKAVPKVAGTLAGPEKIEVVSPEDAKIGIVASYLGTKTQAETLDAFQGVKALLGSGVLTATKEVISGTVPIGPLPPHLQLIAVGEGTFEKPHILLDTSTLCDDVQADETPVVVQQPAVLQGRPFLSIFQRPIIQFPNIFKPITPVKVPVPASPTKYSYKQIHGDGRVTTYTANDDRNVMVTESDQPAPLPPFVTHRIQEVMKIGANGMQDLPVFAGNIQRPNVQYYSTFPKVYPYRPAVSSNNYSYKQIHNDGTATSYASDQNGANVVVTETGKVPAIPAFISDRIEKVAATAVTGTQPNPVVLSGTNIAYWYRPFLYRQPIMDTQGGVQVKVDTKEQQKAQQSSQNTYSYQMVHRDGTVTNEYHGSGNSISDKTEKRVAKPISPVFIEDRLQTIAKTSGGSFSYKILHSDGSVTNYGVYGVHEGIDGENKIVPLEKTKLNQQQGNPMTLNNIQANQLKVKDEGATGFIYKRIHGDGSITSFTNTGVVEDRGQELANKVSTIFPIDANKNFNSDKEETENKVNLNVNTNMQSNQNRNSGFSYKMVHSNGSVTDYQGNQLSNENNSGFLQSTNDKKIHINLSSNQNNDLYKNQHTGENKNAESVSGEHVIQSNNFVSLQNKNFSPDSFSYKAIHSDGSMTIYSQSGVKEINEEQKGTIKDKIRQENYRKSSNELKQNVHIKSENIPVVTPGSFLYKAVHGDGSVTMYSQNGVKEENMPLRTENHLSIDSTKIPQQENNQNMQVNKQSTVVPVSGSISYKVESLSTAPYSQNEVKAANSASDSKGIENVNTPAKQSLDDVKVNINVNEQHLHTNQLHKNVSPSGSYSYKSVHSDGSQTLYSGQSTEEIKAPSSQISTSNKQPSGMFSYKTIHSNGSLNEMHGGSLQQNVQTQESSAVFDNSKLQDEQTTSHIIIPPAPELPNLNDLSVTPVSVMVAGSMNALLTKPVASSYSYKQKYNHHSPDQFTVAVNIDDAAKKDTQMNFGSQDSEANTNAASKVDIIPKDYVYIPPSTTDEPPPIKPLVSAEENKGSQPSVVVEVLSPIGVPCVDKLSEHPIVVLDEPMQYSYEHRKNDGSAMIVESDQSVVSVNISPKQGHSKNRGDIPESP